MRDCAEALFQGEVGGEAVTSEDFFTKVSCQMQSLWRIPTAAVNSHGLACCKIFGRKWVHLEDPSGRRLRQCSQLFRSGLLRPLLGGADAAFLEHAIKLADHKHGGGFKCGGNEDCVRAFDTGDTTVVVNELEHFRPAASLLTREIKRRLGLWV